MLGVIMLIVLLGVEVGLLIYSLRTKSYQKQTKSIVRIATFGFFVLLALIGVIHWGFQWNMLFLILFIKTLMAIWYLIGKKKRKEKIFKKKYVIISSINNALLVTFLMFPAIIFPQFKPLEKTGDYEVKTVSYTLTDTTRVETFSEKQENRKVTVQFWYPENNSEQYPLLVFSHGAFGFRGSNASTYENLASNGYVVCSIDHTYHSFFTKQTDGQVVIANMDFINNAMAAQNDVFDAQTTYDMSKEWLTLRLGDVNFVLDDIKNNTLSADAEEVYQLINTDKIGVFGHSLGGATSAEIGRQREDIDAVIVIDGTMFGEEVGFENGKAIMNSNPYPVPMLNIYNEEHYNEALQGKETYDNMVATANAVDARQVVVAGSGHLNFTDLPMFSPFLASLLGTGEVDSRYCIETMNQIVLDYFNYYLKDAKELNLQEEY